MWLFHKEPPTHHHTAQRSCWRENRGESCHRTWRRKVKLHQEMSCINPLNATWLGGGLSPHLDAEPPSNPLRMDWTSQTLINKINPPSELKKVPRPKQRQLPIPGALSQRLAGLPQSHRDNPSPAWCPKGLPRSRLAMEAGFPQQALHHPTSQSRGTQSLRRSKDPGRG